jgi:hypothetical protein
MELGLKYLKCGSFPGNNFSMIYLRDFIAPVLFPGFAIKTAGWVKRLFGFIREAKVCEMEVKEKTGDIRSSIHWNCFVVSILSSRCLNHESDKE